MRPRFQSVATSGLALSGCLRHQQYIDHAQGGPIGLACTQGKVLIKNAFY
jgi:hypothetical protein